MKIVVIGGTGLIGSKVIKNLRERRHDAVAAAPNTGVNTITGEGLDSGSADAQVVVDLANSPSFEDAAVLEFFQPSPGRNLLKAEVNAGVEHQTRRRSWRCEFSRYVAGNRTCATGRCAG